MLISVPTSGYFNTRRLKKDTDQFKQDTRNKHETLQTIVAAIFYHAQGMLVNLKMIPSFQVAKYTLGIVTCVGDQFDSAEQAKMSLFQFGFSRKKTKGQ